MNVLKTSSSKLIALSLLTLTANSQAADTYDFDSKTLTVPLVTVGNTTYSNVVLKLKDFEVLQIDPNPLTGKVDAGFLLQFVSAVKEGKKVTVTLVVTSQYRDAVATVGDPNYSNNTCNSFCAKLTDDKGNFYTPTATQVGNDKTTSYKDFSFIADIPMTVTFTYDNIATNATSISLLNIGMRGTGDKNPSYQLRNIPFQAPASSSLK